MKALETLVVCAKGEVTVGSEDHCHCGRGAQDQDFRTRIRQDSAHFEQTGSDQDYGFIQVSGSGPGSGFSNFIFGI